MPRIQQKSVCMFFCPACGAESGKEGDFLNLRKTVDFMTDSKNFNNQLKVEEGNRKVITGKKKTLTKVFLMRKGDKKETPTTKKKTVTLFKNKMTLRVTCRLCGSVVIDEHTGAEIIKKFEKGENICRMPRSYDYNQMIIEWMVQKFLQSKNIGGKMQKFADRITIPLKKTEGADVTVPVKVKEGKEGGQKHGEQGVKGEEGSEEGKDLGGKGC